MHGPRGIGRIPVRWRILSALFFARTAIAFQFQTAASAGPFLIDRLGIDFALLGTLIGLYMAPGIVLALPGGLLGQRFGAKRMVLIGLGLMTVGGFLTAVESVIAIFAGRLISGAGAILLNVLMTKMVADWFTGRDIVSAMAVFISSWPLGLAMGLVAFPPLALILTWQAVMMASALFALASLLVVAQVYRDPPDLPQAVTPDLSLTLSRREWLLVSLAGAAWSSFNVGYIVLISFLPETFTMRGYGLSEASLLVSLLGWAMIPLLPLAGYLAERLKRPDLMMFGGLAAAALAATAMPFMQSPIAAHIALAVALALPPGLIMALPAEALKAENRATGMGVYYTWFYVLMAALPAVAGLLREESADAAAPILFAATMMVLAAISLIGFRIMGASRARGTVVTRWKE